MRLQHRAQSVVKVGLMKVQGRNVDRHARQRHTRVFPALELPAHLLDDPKAERDDVPGLLGDGDELVRAQAPALWMIPVQNGLYGVDAMIG
jgi:hypothetical protein